MRKFTRVLIAVVVLVNLAYTSFAQAPQIQPSSPAAPLAPVAPAHRPESVLWDQPLSTVNQNAYVDQEFTDYSDYSSFLADDFLNGEAWKFDTVFVPGNGWNGFSSLLNADALTWQIYADNGGVPDGDPSGGGNPPVWTLTLAPADPQVSITTGSGGMPSDTTLDLMTPVTVPAGHWWLVFFPTMGFVNGGQFGRQPADTTNGYWGQFVNPGGGFGYGTEWQSWATIGAAQQDIAFRLEGPICCGDTVTCSGIAGYPRTDPYGRLLVKWQVRAIDQDQNPVSLAEVTAQLGWPGGGLVTRTRFSHDNGIANFHWGSNTGGTWTIDVTNIVKEGYTFVGGDQCHAEIIH